MLGLHLQALPAGRGFQRHARAPSATSPPTRRLAPACPSTPPERPDAAGPSPSPSPSPSSSNDAAPSSSSAPGPSLVDPVQTIYWGGTLPSTRRAVVGALSGAAIALGGNLGGVTSWLLGLDGGELAGRLRADVLIPVRGAKRCVDYTYGFEFTYPSEWLGDQTLAYRAAKRAEAARGGVPGPRGGGFDDPNDPDFPPLSSSSSSSGAGGAARQRPAVAEPVAAFGPPGTTGEENVSVIVAPISPGFTLQSLGDPRVAGERFLATLAPEGSGLQAALLRTAGRTTRAAGAGSRPMGQPEDEDEQQLYYTLEYTVRGPRFFRHNVSVYTARNDLLYTFNAQCPEARWEDDALALQASAASFKLL
ncbi:Thylakoid-anchored PsbP-like protein [Pleodorina starrii]|uniref:Thylakoid-anchored PsbP-like protein n=1 Tax=Pleodorina starrii TaxID=330485 RepID=A0A9W6F561_9CHLO|nr:Thylakoid-anchored PsbP-like protein [Pleodorina starrii]GLC56071.1 Thylakoid-anchored PsbP-like protein [Pleodorina starrii]GLC64053.1 Thylakoid-anchored PsbP-like protein [Pleodorina starrii]